MNVQKTIGVADGGGARRPGAADTTSEPAERQCPCDLRHPSNGCAGAGAAPLFGAWCASCRIHRMSLLLWLARCAYLRFGLAADARLGVLAHPEAPT